MEAEKVHIPLISGLPDEIALVCIARVPRQYHNTLRCVSKRWRALLCSQEWRCCRRKNNLEETWIYVVCQDKVKGTVCYVLDPDPNNRCWRTLQLMQIPCSKREGMSIEKLGTKLYFLGGCSWQEDTTDEVYCYDSSANHWQRTASMPTARCYFVSASLNDQLYITSGLGLTDSSPNTWDIYDSSSNTWSTHKNPMLTPDIVKFIAMDERLYTIHKTTWNNFFAGVYDPSDRNWQGTNNAIALCSYGPTVVVDGTLYMLDESLGTRLMMWQKENESWVVLGRLSEQLTKPPCQLVAIGRNIFMIGRGLSTVIINVDRAAKVGGVLLCSSFNAKLECDVGVISCKAITI